MSKATIEDAQEVLDGALSDVDDSETKFKIRTAQQFLEALKQQENEIVEIVEEECEGTDRQVFDKLRELGYLAN